MYIYKIRVKMTCSIFDWRKRFWFSVLERLTAWSPLVGKNGAQALITVCLLWNKYDNLISISIDLLFTWSGVKWLTRQSLKDFSSSVPLDLQSSIVSRSSKPHSSVQSSTSKPWLTKNSKITSKVTIHVSLHIYLMGFCGLFSSEQEWTSSSIHFWQDDGKCFLPSVWWREGWGQQHTRIPS